MNKQEINTILEELAKSILDWYFKYFENLEFSTADEDNQMQEEFELLRGEFFSKCLALTYPDIEASIINRYKNINDIKDVLIVFEKAVNNIVFNIIFAKALKVLTKKGELSEEEAEKVYKERFPNSKKSLKERKDYEFNQLKNLLYSIVKRKMIGIHRKKGEVSEVDIDFEHHLSNGQPNVEQKIISSEEVLELGRYFYHLTKEEQVFILLKTHAKLEEKQVADLFGFSLKYVKLKRARLRKKIVAAMKSKEKSISLNHCEIPLLNEILPFDDTVLENIFTNQNHKHYNEAYQLFEEKFKQKKEYIILLLLLWQIKPPPNISTITEVYSVDNDNDMKKIIDYNKSILFHALKRVILQK